MKERNCQNCYYRSRCNLLPFNGVVCQEWRPYMPPRRYLRHLVGAFSAEVLEVAAHVYDDSLADELAAAAAKNQEFWAAILAGFERSGSLPEIFPEDERSEWFARNGWRR